MIGITLAKGQTLTAKDVKKISKTIKRMIKAAREEVLELTYNRIVHPEASITLGLSPTKLVEIRDYLRQAYQERFGK